jgi:hypothetical protein
MREPQTSTGLTIRWVPVVDERGRTHMEARWTLAPGHATPAHAA